MSINIILAWLLQGLKKSLICLQEFLLVSIRSRVLFAYLIKIVLRLERILRLRKIWPNLKQARKDRQHSELRLLYLGLPLCTAHSSMKWISIVSRWAAFLSWRKEVLISLYNWKNHKTYISHNWLVLRLKLLIPYRCWLKHLMAWKPSSKI